MDRHAGCLYLLETPPADIPYGLGIGNHDQGIAYDPDSSTTHFNTYFGVDHFAERPYYGGHYGTDNDNNYQLFRASEMDIVIVHLEPSNLATNATFQGAVAWADGILAAHPDRHGIVVNHTLFSNTTPSFSASGQYLFNELKDQPNLFLMMGGHVNGAALCTDLGDDGHAIYSLLSDYQSETNGGNGYLRIMTFSPTEDQIRVTTYSPTLNQFKTDGNNQFNLAYEMAGEGYQVIGTQTGVASGGTVSVT